MGSGTFDVGKPFFLAGAVLAVVWLAVAKYHERAALCRLRVEIPADIVADDEFLNSGCWQ